MTRAFRSCNLYQSIPLSHTSRLLSTTPTSPHSETSIPRSPGVVDFPLDLSAGGTGSGGVCSLKSGGSEHRNRTSTSPTLVQLVFAESFPPSFALDFSSLIQNLYRQDDFPHNFPPETGREEREPRQKCSSSEVAVARDHSPDRNCWLDEGLEAGSPPSPGQLLDICWRRVK